MDTVFVTVYCPFTIAGDDEFVVQLAAGKFVAFSKIKPTALVGQVRIMLLF